jgi:hypothetical protein
MAQRPVFVPTPSGRTLVCTKLLDFQWHPGLAVSQAQKSISALHEAARRLLDVSRVLEISSKSQQVLGVRLSAFNLMIRTVKYRREFSVESAYQSSKVFELGGPFLDLLEKKSIEAKKDPRLQNHGRLTRYRFFGTDWKLEPTTAFYDWLYINALIRERELAESLLQYEAFTDIAFNPERSINCQAYSAALYCSLHKKGLVTPAVLGDQASYLAAIGDLTIDDAHRDTAVQRRLPFEFD